MNNLINEIIISTQKSIKKKNDKVISFGMENMVH